MYRSLITYIFFIASFMILMGACAKISSPSGGPKDKQPPVVIKTVPENGAKNFMGKSFAITFDEYVVLDNINEKFMVSPPMKQKPVILIKGKSVNVTFEDELKDSTTYTFYFLDAIKDLNEGNVIDNYQFVFSTGPVLDSLSVTGNVYNSFDLEAPEKTLVLMYSEMDDSAVVKDLPDYISRVDQNGYFRFDNVHPGKFRLYALIDIDNSKNYNLIDEEFAFMDSTIYVTTERSFIPVVNDTSILEKTLKKVLAPPVQNGEYHLLLFTALKKDHYLTGTSRNLKFQMIYTLSLPPDSMKFEFSIPEASNDTYFTEKNRNGDTLKVWLTDSVLYSQQEIITHVKYPFTDTLGTVVYKEDTVLMRFLEPRAPRAAKVKKPAFVVDANIRNGSIKPGQQITFTSQTPLRQPDTSRIWLYQLLDTTRIKIPYSLVKDSTNSCKYLFESKLSANNKYLFIADSASFGNIYNESTDSTGIGFSVKDPDSYGKLTLNITSNDGDLIIHLLDKTEKLVREAHLNKDRLVVFPLLENGFYRVRAIYDLNGDGKWNTGAFAARLQPEPVSYYPTELEIKIGWELDQDWDVRVKNMKDQKLRTKKAKKK
ncbi:MAG TPA: Ig-like domain-containing domain [Bacteroidales bacterium]|nr:Ig-like domain-containing domain [Bacteroidales bacterium]